MLRFNFAASAALLAGVFLAGGFVECSDDAPPASNNPATNSTYPPQMLPDAMTDIPAWAGKEKDEPFDVKKFLESRAAPADNAAPVYFESMAEISNLMDFVYPPEQWQERLPKVNELGQDIYNILASDKFEKGLIPLTDVERVLKNAHQSLKLIDEAQQKSQCVFLTGLHLYSRLPHLTAAGQICDLETEQIYHARMKGDFAEAELAIARMLRLACDIRPRGCEVSQCVSINLENCIFDAISKFTITQKNLTVNNCDRLLFLLAKHEHDSIPAFREGFRIEYIIYRNICEEFPKGHPFHEKYLNYLKSTSIKLTSEDLAQANWQKEASTLNDLYSTIIDMADRPYDKTALDRFDQVKAPKLHKQGAVLVSMQLADIPTMFVKVLILQTQGRAHLAGIQSLIAVQRFILAHDQPPSNLIDAVAETGLKSVPLDPFNGQPMHYKIMNGNPIVYSVGPDQKDDGAAWEWNGEQGGGDYIYRIGK
jgi:hypothetical protein